MESGIRAEKSVASTYRSHGWSVVQSAGSRGATTHFVQVKSSSTDAKPYISSSESGRLKSTATRSGATAVIAKVHICKNWSCSKTLIYFLFKIANFLFKVLFIFTNCIVFINTFHKAHAFASVEVPIYVMFHDIF